MKKLDDEIVFVQEAPLAKSNLLINAKYKSSLNCLKIIHMSMLKLQDQQYTVDEESNEMVVTMNASEIKKRLKIKRSGTLYSSLESIARQMVGTTIGMSDPTLEKFIYIALITSAKYEQGCLTITFNHKLKNILIDPDTSFTKLNNELMMSWTSSYTYRLYEILRSSVYYPKDYKGPKRGIFRVQKDLYELKMDLGVINSNLLAVQNILSGSEHPNFKKACEVSPEKMYDDWTSFKRRVLDSGIKEINESSLSDITVKYETLKKAHGEVYAVDFIIYLKSLYKAREDLPDVPVSVDKNEGKVSVSISDVDKFVIQVNVVNLLEKYKLPIADIFAICEVASYDFDAIKLAADILEKSTSKVENVTAWLISAIKHSYQMPITKESNKENKNSFNQFEQREYDFEELEKRLLSN